MKNLNLTTNFPTKNWQMLGEYELSLDAGIDAKIQSWLVETAHPLLLPQNFLNRILKSALDSVKRARQAQTTVKIEHIHVRIFESQDSPSTERTWGFFRIEKVGMPVEDADQDDHSVEFYLYQEGS